MTSATAARPAEPAAPATDAATSEPPHVALARDFGTRAAGLAEWRPLDWSEVAPSLQRGWRIMHTTQCACGLDWRLTFGLVEDSWRQARAAANRSN